MLQPAHSSGDEAGLCKHASTAAITMPPMLRQAPSDAADTDDDPSASSTAASNNKSAELHRNILLLSQHQPPVSGPER